MAGDGFQDLDGDPDGGDECDSIFTQFRDHQAVFPEKPVGFVLRFKRPEK
jgi:hypothetical protein